MKKALGYILGFGFVALSLSACGGTTTAGLASNSCPAGSTQTVQGCLTQGSCQAGYLQTTSQGCQLATDINSNANTNLTCSTPGQVATVQGCIVPTGGSCSVPGTGAPGVYYNGNTCIQLASGSGTNSIIPYCFSHLYSTDGLNSCLSQTPACNSQNGFNNGGFNNGGYNNGGFNNGGYANGGMGLNPAGACVQGSSQPICTNNTYLQRLNNNQYACLSNNQYQNGLPNGFPPGTPGYENCRMTSWGFVWCTN